MRTKEDIKAYQKKWRIENKEKRLAYGAKWRESHKEYCAELSKKWRAKNPDWLKNYRIKNKIKLREYESKRIRTYNKEYHREYYLKHKAKRIAFNHRYQTERAKIDYNFKLIRIYRKRVQNAFRIFGWKRGKSAKLLGCSWDELKKYLEAQFKDGMSWDNHGFYGWHIDHIIPLSSATTQEELEKLCHYTNLQPLWATDNLQKSSSLSWKSNQLVLKD